MSEHKDNVRSLPLEKRWVDRLTPQQTRIGKNQSDTLRLALDLGLAAMEQVEDDAFIEFVANAYIERIADKAPPKKAAAKQKILRKGVRFDDALLKRIKNLSAKFSLSEATAMREATKVGIVVLEQIDGDRFIGLLLDLFRNK